MSNFDKTTARRVARGYRNSYHDLWRDGNGHTMLGCTSKRGPGVAINLKALQQFRNDAGDFVGLQNPEFSVIVPLSKLDGIEPHGGDDYIVVRGGDIGVEVADNVPCPF